MTLSKYLNLSFLTWKIGNLKKKKNSFPRTQEGICASAVHMIMALIGCRDLYLQILL